MIEITKTTLPPLATPAQGDPPETLSDLARDYPGLLIAGGIALGILAGALLPRGVTRKLANGAMAAAAVGSETGLTLARSARAKARNAASEAGEQLAELRDDAAEGAAKLRRRASHTAGDASNAGMDMARAGLKFLSSLRH